MALHLPLDPSQIVIVAGSHQAVRSAEHRMQQQQPTQHNRSIICIDIDSHRRCANPAIEELHTCCTVV